MCISDRLIVVICTATSSSRQVPVFEGAAFWQSSLVVLDSDYKHVRYVGQGMKDEIIRLTRADMSIRLNTLKVGRTRRK